LTSTTTSTTTSTMITEASSSSSSSSNARRSASQSKDKDMLQYNQHQHRSSSQSMSGSASNRSHVSPSRVSRLQEKEEMQNLNDRLAIYIETVRRLESDNNLLRTQVATYSESTSKEVHEIKRLYETELDQAKCLIDELAKEKAKLEIEVNKHKADAEEAFAKLAKRDKEAKSWETRARSSEAQALEFKSRYESLQASTRDNDDELAQVRPLVKELEKQLAKVKKQLEEETLARVDLENKNQTLKEDLSFKSSVYDKEVMQLRTSKRVEVEQADLRMREEYDSRLIAELQRIREDAEDKIQEMKDEVERRYQSKLGESESSAKRHLNSSNAFKEEISTLRSRVEELQVDEKNYIKKIATLEQKCRDNEEKLRALNVKYSKDMSDKEKDIELKNKELHDMLMEYQELYDIKVALDMEISAYRKLLESEEQRLNISNLSTMGNTVNTNASASYLDTSSSKSPRAGAKKRRLQDTQLSDELMSSSAASQQYIQTQQNTCGIEIDQHDQTGKQVRLVNNSGKEISLSGWKLSRKANEAKSEFKFGKSASIKAGQHVSVWSSDAGVKQTAPHDFVMSSSQKWCTADAMVTVLVDKEEIEKSRRESRKQETATATSSKKLTESNSSSSRLGIFSFFGSKK